MKAKKIILAGGTGFIGQFMCNYFGKNNKVVVLTRNVAKNNNNAFHENYIDPAIALNIKYVEWDGRTMGPWAQELNGADIVINLAGRSVNCRYNFRNMKEIFASRKCATEILGKAINNCTHPPVLWINAASATTYRHATDHEQDEFDGEISDLKAMNMPSTTIEDIKSFLHRFTKWVYPSLFITKRKRPEKDFSVRVCRLWEKTFFDTATPHTRKVCLRVAITLGPGGVMIPYFNLLKFGLGGRQGNGRQMYSWVHIEDLCRLIEWLDEYPQAEGIYNCASPHPVSNNEFMKSLRKITGHIIGLPAYKWMLEIGAKIIGTETELILKSRWVVPARLLQAGFKFKYASVDKALKDIVGKVPHKKYHLF
jgi:uncharacterized protein